MKMDEFEVLEGGNMNKPLKRDDLIYKDICKASETIHRLLCHVQKKGISWIPKSLGIKNNKHILQYIEGEVPDAPPDWLWDIELLRDVAAKLRQWHDATKDFNRENAIWLLENDEPDEVICHCDFAPYNCVFENHQFKGLIDFDVCSPGSRLWDISYAVYRFIPLMPQDRNDIPYETIIDRLRIFLESYSRGESEYRYEVDDVIKKVRKRLQSLSEWTHDYGVKTANQELKKHAEMYMSHADWVMNIIESSRS